MKKITILILIIILTNLTSKSQCLSGDCNNGYGQYQYGNGGVYQGNFKNGLENGSGTLIFASGAKYIGEFYNGKKNGKGIYYYTSGEIQDGDFVNGNFVNGKDKLASGDTYIGEFLNGAWNGNGTYIWADGEKYVGGFKNGVFHGIGKKYLTNGTIVEGEWSNGTMIKKTGQNTVTTNTKSSEATTFPTNGLVGWWPFNGNANDESGNGNNGNVYGATLTSDRLGNPNKAYSFDGISNYILVPNSNSLNITGSEITISYWLYNQKIDNTQKGVSKGGWDVGAGYEFLFSEEKGLQLSGSRGGLQRTDASNISFYNNWVHLVAVFNNGIGVFYINNVKVNAKLNGNQFTAFSGSSLPLIFGKRSDQNVYAKGYINGKMDDIAIWNRALSENEISSLYNSGINNSNNISTSNTKPSEDINCELARKKYLEQNPDVAKAGMDAWNHYTSYGKREGRKWPACAENANNNNFTSDYDFGINTITYSYSGNSQSDEFYVKKQILMSSLSYLSVNFLDHVDITQKELKKKELARMCELLYKKLPILKQEVLDMYFSSEQQNKYNNATVPEIYAVLAEVFCVDNNSFNKSVWSKLPIKIDGVQLNNSALKTNSTNLPTKTNDNIILYGYNVGKWNYNDNSKSIVCLLCKKQCAVKKSTEEIEKEKLKKIKDIENGNSLDKQTFEARMKHFKTSAQSDGLSPEEYVFKNHIKDNPSHNKVDLFDAAYNYWNLNYSLFFVGHFCSETHLNAAAKIYDAEAKKNMENARSSSNSSSNSSVSSNSQSSSNPSKTNNPSLTTSIKQAPTKGFEFEIVVKWDATTMNGECATNFQLINCKMDHFSPTKNCSFSVEPTCPKCHHSSLENTKTGWCLQSHFPEECIKKFKVTCKYCDK